MMLWVLAGVPVLALLVFVGWRMLRAIADSGGQRAGDAAEAALQVLAQSDAFRGDDSDSGVRWDGVPRLQGVQGNDGGA